MAEYKYKDINDLCDICSGKGTEENPMTYHHVMPQQIRICNKKENVVPLCRLCHDYVEYLYEKSMKKLNPLYEQKFLQMQTENSALNAIKYYKDLCDAESDEKLEEYLTKFRKRGGKLSHFNVKGHEKIHNEEKEKSIDLKIKVQYQLEGFNWRELYNNCKAIIKLTEQFRVSPSLPEIP